MSPRKKIPTKTELAQLQKLYKTDEKIGERLGGVPAYLVAYWRRKKGIPKYSLPKFSEKEIYTLWERYGDDDKCGLELGISKAAYYNWRRRYGIREKPAFLKLEQLELNFPGLRSSTGSITLFGEQTIAQKIIAKLASIQKAEIGDTIEIEPDMVISQNSAMESIDYFRKQGSELVFNSSKIALSLAGPLVSDKQQVASSNKKIREFARRQSIRFLFDMAQGYCNQLMMEIGLIHPGHFILGGDQQSASLGALSVFADILDAQKIAESWASGKHSLKVPSAIRIDIGGRRVRSIGAKDVGLYITGQINKDDSKDRVIEYYGSVVSQFSVSERSALCSLAVGLSARAAICHFDSTTRRYLTNRTINAYSPVVADKDAIYDNHFQINIDTLSPQIAGPNSLDQIRQVAELEGTVINQVILGTCSSGRFDDLRIGAEIIKGKKINPDCRLIVIPGSRAVYLDAIKKGIIRAYVEAGAVIMNPGAVYSPEMIRSMIAPGEKCLATTATFDKPSNGNGGELFICSPATAAASALNGAISDPTRYLS